MHEQIWCTHWLEEVPVWVYAFWVCKPVHWLISISLRVLALEYTLPTDQLFNLEFQFKSAFNLDFQPEFGIQLGTPILIGINLGGCRNTLKTKLQEDYIFLGKSRNLSGPVAESGGLRGEPLIIGGVPCKHTSFNGCLILLFPRQWGVCFFLAVGAASFFPQLCPTPPQWLMVHPKQKLM